MADPVPKPAAQRRRRNKDTPKAVKLLADGKKRQVPELPGAETCLPATQAWWKTVWSSPMALVYLEADVPALVRLASLMELSYQGEASAAHLSEIRQLEDRFGLSPLARRRLQWEIEQAGGGETEASGGTEGDGRWLRAVSD